MGAVVSEVTRRGCCSVLWGRLGAGASHGTVVWGVQVWQAQLLLQQLQQLVVVLLLVALVYGAHPPTRAPPVPSVGDLSTLPAEVPMVPMRWLRVGIPSVVRTSRRTYGAWRPTAPLSHSSCALWHPVALSSLRMTSGPSLTRRPLVPSSQGMASTRPPPPVCAPHAVPSSRSRQGGALLTHPKASPSHAIGVHLVGASCAVRHRTTVASHAPRPPCVMQRRCVDGVRALPPAARPTASSTTRWPARHCYRVSIDVEGQRMTPVVEAPTLPACRRDAQLPSLTRRTPVVSATSTPSQLHLWCVGHVAMSSTATV